MLYKIRLDTVAGEDWRDDEDFFEELAMKHIRWEQTGNYSAGGNPEIEYTGEWNQLEWLCREYWGDSKLMTFAKPIETKTLPSDIFEAEMMKWDAKIEAVRKPGVSKKLIAAMSRVWLLFLDLRQDAALREDRYEEA